MMIVAPALIGTIVAAMAVAPSAGSKCVVLKGVDRYRYVEPMFEGVRIILSYRGEKLSPAYVQGVSGAAFRVAGPCPCAPTCCQAMEPADLIRRLGYEVEPLQVASDADISKRTAEIVERVHHEIDAGRPVLVFHAFTSAEWDVVCGYDVSRREFLGRGSYAGLRGYAHAGETRFTECRDICGIIGATVVGKRVSGFDRRTLEITALREAVAHSQTKARQIAFSGLQCYDVWLDRWKPGGTRKADFGADGYTSGIYRSTRRAAAAFLREIAPRYPSAEKALQRAAGRFASEGAALSRFHDVLFAQSKTTATDGAAATVADRAYGFLQKARSEYAAGISDLREALAAIDAEAAGR